MGKILVFLFLLCQQSQASNYSEAIKSASKATYIQSGLNTVVNSKLTKLEHEYVSPTVKDAGTWLLVIQRVVLNKQISGSWSW